MANSPHDALFRLVFSQLEHATGLWQTLLEPDTIRVIEWPSLTLCAGTFVDRRLRRQQSDLLFSVRMGGRRIYLYLLFEHKSANDRWTALQLLGYLVAIWKSLRRGRRRARRLPLILPVVLHHGPRGWTASTNLQGLLDTEGVPAEVAASLLRWQPQFRYLVKSLAECRPEDVRGMALTMLGKLTLGALQFLPGAEPEQVVQTLVGWADLVRHVMVAPSGHEALAAISEYILTTTKIDPEVLIEVVERQIHPEASMKMQTGAAKLRAAGRQEGRQEGREEGLAQGRSELLRRLLQARFGALPEAIEARLVAADRLELERWAIRCIDAGSLADVFRAD